MIRAAGASTCSDYARVYDASRLSNEAGADSDCGTVPTPSSKLYATIAAFCSAVQARRRPAPVKISSRCAGRQTFRS